MFVTVTSGMRGFFAVLVDETDGFPEPVQTGVGSYRSPAEAAVEAQDWARAEGLPYREAGA